MRLLLEDRGIERKSGVQLWDAGPSLDQGNTGTCVGHAWAHYSHDGPVVNGDVDAIDLYVRATELDEWRENDPFTDRGGTVQANLQFGTSVRAGAKALRERGVIGSFWWAKNLTDVVHALLNVGPVVVGTDWYESMFRTDLNNAMWRAGDVVGGHAYLLNGVDTDRKMVRVKNSWGRRWGREGSAWMYVWDFEYLLDGGEACLAVELEAGVVSEDRGGDIEPTVQISDVIAEILEGTVGDVTSWMEENPEYADQVVEAERAGKGRKGIVGG